MENESLKKLKASVQNQELIEESWNLLNQYAQDEKSVANTLKIAENLHQLGADDLTIAASLLHYLPENNNLVLESISLEQKEDLSTILRKSNQIQNLYGDFKNLKFRPIDNWQKKTLSEQGENLRKMFFALSQDLRPIFILLARNWELMKNIHELPAEQQRWFSQGALEVLAPLAYSLGMLEAKGKLEDLAFPILYPKEYNWLEQNVSQKYEERQSYLDNLTPSLTTLFKKEKINTLDIHKRAKHYFSLYQKLIRHEMNLERIYDLVALRIIVSSVPDCYKVLGVLHKNWSPLQGRIKDYISQPKLNGYRSLHTTVSAPSNIITEFQIKTPEMHREAEYGAAAHLSYKNQPNVTTYKHQYFWMDQVRRLKEESQNPTQVIQFLKNDFLKEQIFVFTPKGDIINLPKDSTSIDFAYAVHSSLGDHCELAKIDGKAVSLKTPLKTGQKVEIIVNNRQNPSLGWLRFVKTKKAQEKIKKYLLTQNELSSSIPQALGDFAKGITQGISQGFSGLGEGISQGVQRLKKLIPSSLSSKKKKNFRVLIGNETGITYKLSQCCQPQPVDEIIAFITQGKGASVHKITCQNFKTLQAKSPERVLSAKWQ
ncbi:MAG: TGS domain-containing protein [Candidatus Gribaldobacteria bacterium]|nr:TGS domain-containing protein [Candidatus Gribaldobacteria bacterium]